MKIFISLFFIFFLAAPFSGLSQVLIPYLGENGKYGYATEDGKIQTPPAYEDLPALGEKDEYADLRIGNKFYLFFRNGTSVPKYAQPVQVGKWEKSGMPANINIAAYFLADSIFLMRRDASSSAVFPYFKWRYSYPKYFSPSRSSSFSYGRPQPVQFIAGVAQLEISPESVIFIDTLFRRVGTDTFAAARVINPEFWAVSRGTEKVALMHKSGHLVTPFVFNSFMETRQEGLIVAAVKLGGYKEKVGMINSLGTLVIDTIFDNLYLSGTHFLVGIRNDTSFVLDYTGQILFQTTAYNLTPGTGDYFIGRNKETRSFSFISAKDFSIVGIENFKGIEVLKAPGAELFSCTLSDYSQVLLMPNLIPLFQESFSQIKPAFRHPELLITVMHKTKDTYGLRNFDGNMLLQQQYDSIYQESGYSDYFHFIESGLHGLMNASGKTVLPCKYNAVTLLRDGNSRELIIYAQKKPKQVWMAFDSTGTEKNIPARYTPYSIDRAVLNFDYEAEEFILGDGSRKPFGNIWSEYEYNGEIKNLYGGFAKFKNIKNECLLVFNDQLKSLVPSGFAIPEQLLNLDNLYYTGLLPVFAFPEGKIDTLSFLATLWNPAPPPPRSGVEYLEKIDDGKEDNNPFSTAYQERKYDKIPPFTACGVVDVNGNWVLPPKSGVRYYPISHYLIAELPYGEHCLYDAHTSQKYVLHEVGGQKVVSYPVDVVAYPFFKNGGYIAVGKTDPKTHQMLFAYVDTLGKEITPRHFINGPNHLTQSAIAVIPDGRSNVSVRIDKQGKITGRFPGLNKVKDPFDFEKKLEKSGHYIMRAENSRLVTLFDSTGARLLPGFYQNLAILDPYARFLTTVKTDGSVELLDRLNDRTFNYAQGEELLHISGFDGKEFITSSQHTLMFSSNKKEVEKMEWCKCFLWPIGSDPYNRNTDFLYCKLYGQRVWVNFRNQMVYKVGQGGSLK